MTVSSREQISEVLWLHFQENKEKVDIQGKEAVYHCLLLLQTKTVGNMIQCCNCQEWFHLKCDHYVSKTKTNKIKINYSLFSRRDPQFGDGVPNFMVHAPDFA